MGKQDEDLDDIDPTAEPVVAEPALPPLQIDEDEEPITEVDIKMLLEAGVHFGHQTKRWNPKMARYIFGRRNDIHVLDLQKTMKGLERSRKFLVDVATRGGKVLFVSTKKQAQEIVQREAARAGMFWVTERWLGGMLTNYETIQKRVKHLRHLEKMKTDGLLDALGKKEASKLRKQMARLEKYLGGIKDMRNLPDAIFLIDPKREAIAVKECRKLKIPLVAIVDTNCDPDEIDYVIPGNDDAIRSIKLISQYIASALSQVKAEKDARKAKADAPEAESPTVPAAPAAEPAGANAGA